MAPGSCSFCHHTTSCALSPTHYITAGTWWLSVFHPVSISVSYSDFILCPILIASIIGKHYIPCCVRHSFVLFVSSRRTLVPCAALCRDGTVIPRGNSLRLTFLLIFGTVLSSNICSVPASSFFRHLARNRGVETRSRLCASTFRTCTYVGSVIRRSPPPISVRYGKRLRA